MILYLIRWPRHPKIAPAIMAARSLAKLIDQLDEEADPGMAEYRRYTGPFALDLAVGGEVVAAAEWGGDTGGEMHDHLRRLLDNPKGWKKVTDVPLDQWPEYLQLLGGNPAGQQRAGVTLPEETLARRYPLDG
jgi:hypothetical protein